MDTRKLILKTHLYLGIVSAIFLIILGLTGSIMAFEGDIDHWLHPSRWYVTVQSQALPESQLIQKVEQQFAPARVAMVQVAPEANIAQVMSLASPGGKGPANPRQRMQVLVNQYDGTVLFSHDGQTKTQATLATIHQIHLRLLYGQTGKLIVSFIGLLLVFEVPLGLILWWRTKRAGVQWKGGAHRLSFDLHHVVGAYAAIFLFLSAVTGCLIGFDFAQQMFFKLTNSKPPAQVQVKSAVVDGATPVGVDKAIEVALQTMPGTNLAMLQLPNKPAGVYDVSMRFPGQAWSGLDGSIKVDQFSGSVLSFQDNKNYPGLRASRFNRALHTGDIYGFSTHVIMSLTSLILVVMVVTGLIIWWKKLAI